MKTSNLILGVFGLLIMIGCSSKVQAPKGSVPRRTQLENDRFGSYIRVHATNKRLYLGELIGQRNDSLVVLGDSIVSIAMGEIDSARVIVHAPANYNAGLLALVPNLALFTLSGYGGAPAELGSILSLIDLIGYSAAAGTENMKINYYDWTNSQRDVLKYARFPGGIPPTIKLSEIEPRRLSKNE